MMLYKSQSRRFIFAFLTILVILFAGVAGYIIIEGFTLLEALYMTVITVATVGFTEVRPLSDAGRIFTIVLIILSLGTFAYALTQVTGYLIQGEMRSILRSYKSKSGIRKMKNHVIICGYGRNGRQAAQRFIDHREPFVVIDNNHDTVTTFGYNNISFVEGDATEEEVLKNAGIAHARALVTTLPIDADNLYVVLSARALNPELRIISRATGDGAEQKLKIAGADRVVIPEKVGGAHMASLIINPDILEFMNSIFIPGEDSTKLVELNCENISEKYIGRSIQEMGVRVKTGANIIGYKSPDGKFAINPSPDTVMTRNSKLIVLGTPEQIQKMKELLAS